MLVHDEVRILQLLPSPNNDTDAPILCNIVVVKLSNSPAYEALSYVWDVGGPSANIVVSGRPISITRGLYQALRQLRLPGLSRSLWVDQLCIEQWNLDEKAQQVRHMHKIYRLCSRCLAWLGVIREDISLADAKSAFDLFEYLAAAWRPIDASRIPLPAALTNDPTAIERAMKALEPLLKKNNPWWNRIWTVQEAALPVNFAFIWGPLTLPWDIIEQAILTYKVKGWPEPLSRLLLQYSDENLVNFIVHAVWINVTRLRLDNPLETICRWRDRKATDPRDNIFGLLGLFELGDLPLTRNCDYSLSAASIFRSLTVELIVNEKGLRPLIADPRLGEDIATPSMPRWALDLVGQPTYPTDWPYHSYSYAIYNADKGLQLLDVNQLADCSSRDALVLKGIHIDTIVLAQKAYETTNPFIWDVPIEPVASAMREWYAVVEGKADSLPLGVPDPYPTGCSRSEAFARLMLGDIIRGGEQWPEFWASDEDFDDVWKLMDAQPLDREFCRTVHGMLANRALFITETGLMGLGHLETQAGDQVWIFRGGKVPFVVRARGFGNDSEYDFVGACYVQGIMQGERLGNMSSEKDSLVERTIQIF